jgi:hypothetical protein
MSLWGEAEHRNQSFGNDGEVSPAVQLAAEVVASYLTDRMEDDHISDRRRWREGGVVGGHS